MVEDLNKTNEILAYVDSELSDAEARSIGTRINQIENVYKSEFKSRETALEEFIAAHENDPAFGGLVPSDLRHRYVIELEDHEKMAETVAQIEKIPGIAKINASFEMAEGFVTIKNMLHIASAAVIIFLLAISLLIISNTVKLALYDRKEEIAIMKMVGATNGFIRLPYLVEGFILGMVSATIAFFLNWAIYNMLVNRLAEADTLKLFSFVPFDVLLQPMIITFAAAGLLVGVIGSWSSIRKFLDV